MPKTGRRSADREQGSRILVVAPQPVYEDRGTPIAVRQLAEALTQLSYDVEVLTYPVGRPLDVPGVELHRAANPFRIRSVPIGFSLRKLLLDATLVLALRARLRHGRYACVHALEEAAFAAVVLARPYGLPVIYDMQSSLPEQLVKHRVLRTRGAQWALRRAERWLLRRADLVASSAGLAERVRRMVPDARVREWHFSSSTMPPAPEDVAELRRELALPDGAPVVVYSGSFAHYQGIPELLRAVSLVRRAVPAAVFVMVGSSEGHLDDGEAAEVAELERSGALRLVSQQPRERMPCYLALGDVLVSSRRYGGNLPLKIFDYLAAGRPIVATDIPAHRAVLDDTRALLVGRRGEDLADAIVALLADPARAAALAAGARSYADEHLGWSRFVRVVAGVYEEALASREEKDA